MSVAQCGHCARPLGRGSVFQFRTSDGMVFKCLGCAIRHRPMLRRSLLIALIVGTILVTINQADLLLRGDWRPSLIWKVPLTYLVPFVVATWSALINSRIPNAERKPD
jgi:hypothetical protein